MEKTNAILDLETKYHRDLVLMIDGQLKTLLNEARQSLDSDGLGYFDSAEHLTGLGFVTCQAYMTACYGIIGVTKSKALLMGPKHQSGSRVVEIINHAANYWKHNNEWPKNKNDHYKVRISKAFDSIGFPIDGEYPLGGVLTELSAPQETSFETILNKLETWCKELNETKCT